MCVTHCTCHRGANPAPRIAVWVLRGTGTLLLMLAVVAFRWCTGAPLRPSWTGRRLVTRPVRAAGQLTATVVAVGLLLNWWITLIAVGAVSIVATGTAAGVRVAPQLIERRRESLRATPRRVTAIVGTPIRPESVGTDRGR